MVNPNRIAIVGHSMGAGAALDYGSRDAGIAAAVMISGGFRLDGPEQPRNAMFIHPQHDLPFFAQLAGMMASHAAGVESIAPGKPYGDFAAGTAVEALEIPDDNHVSIIRSEQAARAILAWLDSACEVARDSSPDMSDSRLATARIGFVLIVVPMFRLGWISGRFGTLFSQLAKELKQLWAGQVGAG
jgi:pimeloyl-ACP methyl ester carboxylesterase